MKVVLANTLGFCGGVRKAVNKIYSELENTDGNNIFMEGPIIHNNSVIDDLESKGVRLLNEADNIIGKKVVVRAHGITPGLEHDIKKRGGYIVDGTCPIVKASQNKIKQYAMDGYFIVISGDKGHAEVIGLVGQAPENSIVVASSKDLQGHLYPEKTLLISQTTFSRPEFEEIEKHLKSLCPTIISLCTICDATKKRQDSVIELSNQVDAIIVVGGLTSSNTKRLKTAAQEFVPTWLIEDAEGIPLEIYNFEVVGVTAGASTPDWVIEKVLDTLNKISS